MTKGCTEKDEMRCPFPVHSGLLYTFFPDAYPIRVLMLKPDAET